MLTRLKTGPKAVGAKQSRRAIADDRCACAFLAADADPNLTDPIRSLCREHDVPVEEVSTMKALGAACGISVGAAVAVLLRE
ncbi:MAG: ribosomal L7Ae/L30e/S12e/Gadd45 family protein [Oscillospiraceae bacterium]|nr:ribosomal L7Ae/L30e/S12e/Gadd45 family protein [Oscillospiraceae bacterium]